MQQGKVIVWMPLLIGLYGLLELGHHRLKGVLLVEPMGKQMHPHKRHMGHDPHNLCATGNCQTTLSVTRTALATIHPPCGPPPIDMAKAHSNGYLPLGHFVGEQPTRALGLLLEQAPQQSRLTSTELWSRTKGWTGNLIVVILLQVDCNGLVRLEQ